MADSEDAQTRVSDPRAAALHASDAASGVPTPAGDNCPTYGRATTRDAAPGWARARPPSPSPATARTLSRDHAEHSADVGSDTGTNDWPGSPVNGSAAPGIGTPGLPATANPPAATVPVNGAVIYAAKWAMSPSNNWSLYSDRFTAAGPRAPTPSELIRRGSN